MSLSMEDLEKRKGLLQECLGQSENMHLDLKERMKNLKKEIANTRGAIIEIEHLMDEVA